ncbi:hypothetical protein [Sediminibacterium goheungense]|uniref:Tetratricopeptide repeat protein n=1 Tax=Sediminibacterium goheungense TaxID=1086393 RepID=A0A4R6ITB9_9BACT|nr:hypothetical protein [Sediminibacterium goheungense]TDO25155.1 hypothetical protein BC659_3171 [Sediminibacterium goheungense]
MKKLLLLSMIAMSLQFATAQDYKKVQNAFLLGRIEDAKTELDKLLADPKTQAQAQLKPETYVWKAKIYASFFKDKQLSAKYPNAETEAATALKKYEELDPTYAVIKEKDGIGAYFDMYATLVAQGSNRFAQKDWSNAGQSFVNALAYIDQIIANKWTSNTIPMDTTSILYAAICFQNAKELEKASIYYRKIADNKINDTNYVDVYRFLVDYYTRGKKDEKLFYNYLGIAREVHPSLKEEWESYEMDFIDTYDLKAKTELYAKEEAAGTLTEAKYIQYGSAFANAKMKDDIDSASAAMYNNKALDAFKKAFAKNDKSAIAAFNAGVICYNNFGELDDKVRDNIRTVQRINAEKPVEKDPKKKAAADAKVKAETEPYLKANTALEAPIAQQVDQAIEWLEKAYLLLKDKANRTNNEKSVINKSVDWLANLYSYKRDKVRGKDNAAFDKYEAKFKEYDAMHSKF